MKKVTPVQKLSVFCEKGSVFISPGPGVKIEKIGDDVYRFSGLENCTSRVAEFRYIGGGGGGAQAGNGAGGCRVFSTVNTDPAI